MGARFINHCYLCKKIIRVTQPSYNVQLQYELDKNKRVCKSLHDICRICYMNDNRRIIRNGI